MSYAYHDERAYTVRIKDDDHSFSVELIDRGIPFDPLSASAPVIDGPLEILETKGLGVFLMRRMTDEVSYVREGDRNILTLTMHKA